VNENHCRAAWVPQVPRLQPRRPRSAGRLALMPVRTPEWGVPLRRRAAHLHPAWTACQPPFDEGQTEARDSPEAWSLFACESDSHQMEDAKRHPSDPARQAWQGSSRAGGGVDQLGLLGGEVHMDTDHCWPAAPLARGGWVPIPYHSTVSRTFNSLFKVLCIFRSLYLFAIGLVPIFSLMRGIPHV